MKVSDLIHDAFDQAIRQHEELYKSWVDISIQLDGRILPFSLLGPTVHDIGELDLVLRCMENETKAVINNTDKSKSDSKFPVAHWHQNTLSKIWVSEIYEVFRLLKSRGLVQKSNTFNELENHLRLLRIPFEKHEIAKDKKLEKHLVLTEEQASKQRTSIFQKFGDLSEYDSNDPRRVYSLNSRNTPRGSIEWKALDLDTGEALWLERLSLSERVLELFQHGKLCDSQT